MNSLEKFSTEITEGLESILTRAKVAAVAEQVEKAAKLAVHIIEACNPFKTVFAGDTASSILNATA